jgi:hypothetical protein
MKVKFWTYVADCGDGSAVPYFFSTEKKAYAFKKMYEKETGTSWGEDCISLEELTFDDKTGMMVDTPKDF